MPRLKKQKNIKISLKPFFIGLLPLVVLGIGAVVLSWINFGILKDGIFTKGVRGGSVRIFPVNVEGDWENIANSKGEPDIDGSGDLQDFSKSNSTFYMGGLRHVVFSDFRVTRDDLESQIEQPENKYFEYTPGNSRDDEDDAEMEIFSEEDVELDEEKQESEIEEKGEREENETEENEESQEESGLKVLGAKTSFDAQVLNLEQIEKSDFEGAKIFLSFAAGQNASHSSFEAVEEKDFLGKLGELFARKAKANSDDQLDAYFDTAIMVKYSVDGESWEELDFFSEEISNKSNGGYFNYDASLITSWEDLKNLQIKIEGLVEEQASLVGLLDSIWVQVKYGRDEQDEKLQIFSDRRAWRKDEHPKFRIEDPELHDSFLDKTRDKVVAAFQEDADLTVKLTNARGEEFELKKNRDFRVKDEGSIEVELLPQNDLPPGSYVLDVLLEEDGEQQNFEGAFDWGVLAVNFNKSIYLEDETAHVQLAALNETGHTLCDANLQVEIIEPDLSNRIFRTKDGSIEMSVTCGPNNVTDIADYFFHYETGKEGVYEVTVTNLDKDFEITDSFEVGGKMDFEVERIGATRINPFKAEYEMTFNIEANDDFEGSIIETVPASFEIQQNDSFFISEGDEVKYITWENVQMDSGGEHSFSYVYQAPKASPLLHLLGPLRLEGTKKGIGNWLVLSDKPTFKEARQWQIASDAVGDIGIWRDSAGSQIPGTTFAAMNFATQQRNDGDYTFTGSNNLNLDSGGNYLLIATLKYDDSSNGRFTPEARFTYTGSGNFVTSYGSGYTRNTANRTAWVRAIGLVWGAAADDDVQLEVRRDTDAPTGGSVANASHFQVVRLDTSTAVGMYTDTSDTGGYDSQTWTDAPFNNIVYESDTSAIERQSGNTDFRLKSNNTTFLVGYGMAFSGATNRVTRSTKIVAGTSDIENSFAYAYARDASNEYADPNGLFLYRNTSTSTDLSVQAQRDNSTSNAGVARRTSTSGMFIVELPSAAEVFISHDSTGAQDVGGTSGDFNIMRDVDHNNSAAFTKVDNTTMNCEKAMDVLLMMQAYGERSDTSGTRMTAGTRFEIQGADQSVGEHGDYLRGNESSGGPSYNVGFASAGLFSVSSGDDVQVEWFDGGDNGSTDYTTGDAVGFSALNLDTLTGGPALQQVHFHWRDDNDDEENADSLTSGNEDTNITALAKSTTARLRLEVSNEGTATSASTQYRLEWGEKSTSCSAISTWVNMDTGSDDWEMYNTSNLTDGDDTTNIAESTGGVTDENTTFLVNNNAVKDTSATTAGFTLASTEFAELEYSIRATSSATDGATYCFRVTNAGSVINAYNVYPEATLEDDDLTQIHYHWRFDDGSQAAATSATGGIDDTIITDFAKQVPIRLRLEVSNEGELNSASTQYRLEWGVLGSGDYCSEVSSWVNMDTGSDAWEMYNSSNLTDGDDTTNIAEGIGGVADENTTFIVDNNGVKDTSATTGGITLTTSEYLELEYSIQATSSAVSGTHYCFRVTDAGTPIKSYDVYPHLSLYLSGVIGESGIVTTDYAGTTVNLNNQYENPVVLVEPLSGDDSGSATNRPAAAVITAKTSTSFTVKVQEPDNETDDHGDETFSFLAMEEGAWTLPDSRLVDVGSLSTSAFYGNGVTGDSYADCNFTHDFSADPEVLYSLQTNNNTGTPDFLTAQGINNSATTDDFDCCIEVPDNETNTPGSAETIGWVAMNIGTGTNNSVRYEVGNTGTVVQGWDDTWGSDTFTGSWFTSTPLLLANKQSLGGADGGWPRYDNLSSTGFSLAVDERDDSERSHTGTEDAGWLAIESAGNIVVDPQFNQVAYRLFQNADSTDVGTALAAQDTAATLSSDGQAFRLRTLVNVSNQNLRRYGGGLRLQFAERSGTCDTSFTGETYTDVTMGTDIAFNDNTTPADGAALTNNVNDPDYTGTEVNQTYEELNIAENIQAAVDTSENGKWDFALKDNTAPSSTSYCFRMVSADGVVFDTYTVVPEITTASTGFSVSGTVYLANETTQATTGNGGQCDSSTSNLSLRVNGGSASTTTCSSTDGSFTFTGVSASAGDTITIYSTDSTDKSNRVYVSDGTADIGMDLYKDTIALGDEQDGSLNILDTVDYDNDQNSGDMLFDAEDTTTDTFVGESGIELHIHTGDTFAPNGDVTTAGSAGYLHVDDSATFTQGSTDHTIGGDVLIDSSATLGATDTGDFYVGGSWTNAGTFTHNDGTVTFNATTTGHTITDGDSAFYDILFNGSGGDWIYTDGTSTAPNSTTVQNGTPTFLNTKTGTVSVTGGTLNVDWYVGTHVVDAESTSTDIDTGDNDVTFSEEGDNSTVWQHNGFVWGSGAGSQTTGTNASGDNPQPNDSGAIRIREFSMTASASCPGAGCTLYKYNEQVAWTSSYGEYDYHDDYGENYLTSCWAGSTASCSDDTTDDDVIGVNWYRSTIGTMNTPLSTVNEPPTNGSWHVGMLEALSFSIDSFSRDYGVMLPGSNPTDLTNTLTATSSASHGYVIYARAIQDMTCSNTLICGAATISDWSGTNASPTTWSGGSFGFGYSTNDYDLQGGASNRFSGPNFAGFVETGFGDPVVDRTGPSSDQENVVTYRIAPGAIQNAGPYQTSIVYVIVATY